jgi:hypothetical protein
MWFAFGGMMFEIGEDYTRSQIHELIGGSMQPCLVRSGENVIAVCFLRGKNPRAPGEIFVGRGPSKEAAAELFVRQPEAAPTFEKITKNAWRYLGLYRCLSYATEPRSISEANRASNRTDVAGVLRLERA